MLLNPCQLSTQSFTRSLGQKMIFAEASELGFKPGEVPGGLLYDDACDAGITLVNMHSGKLTHWYQSEDIMVGDEVIVWTYKPTTETTRRQPETAEWAIHILND